MHHTGCTSWEEGAASRQKPNRRIFMRKPSMPPPKTPRQLRRLQQAQLASAQDTALLWQLCAPSRSRRH